MSSQNPIKLLLVDDHDVVRSGIRALLEAQKDMEVVGEASNGLEALQMLEVVQPDVVLMDITMKGMDGLEATRLMKQTSQQAAVLVLTIHEGREYFFEMLNSGASGYIPKSAAPEELMIAIRAVARGEVYLHSSVARLLLRDYMHNEKDEEEGNPGAQLTGREQEVLTLLAEGMVNREIGEELGISPRTVARHRENIMRKLGLHSRTELVKYAIRIGLIDIEED